MRFQIRISCGDVYKMAKRIQKGKWTGRRFRKGSLPTATVARQTKKKEFVQAFDFSKVSYNYYDL